MTTTNGKTISYDYDVLGNKRSMTTPGAKTVLYGYDTLNRLSTVTHPGGAVTTFGYDKVGNRQSVTRQTSTGTVFSTTGYTYDPLNRLTDIVNKNGSNAVVSSYHYQLRADGKRSSVTDALGITNYTYDDQGKLTLEAGPYATIAYGYDNVGNRLTRTVTNAAAGNGTTLTNGPTNTAYDANDRIVGHTYDLDGNETTVNGQAASYDFENHLISLGSVANYAYDADGNRYSAANLGTTTNYVVDTSLPHTSVVEEYTGSSLAASARYDYGDDLIRVDHGTAASYYLYDGLGSTRQLVNTAGSVTDTWSYSAFGELASHTGSTANPFLFNAQQFDQATGNYYLRARYYDQSNGRFLGQDANEGNEEDPITLHRYLYAGAEPVDQVDPSGNDFTTFALCIVMAFSSVTDSQYNSATIRGGAYASTQIVGTSNIAIASSEAAAASAGAVSSQVIAGIGVSAAAGSSVSGYLALGGALFASTISLFNAANYNSSGLNNPNDPADRDNDEEDDRGAKVPTYTIHFGTGYPEYNSVKTSLFPEAAQHITAAILRGKPFYLYYDADKDQADDRRTANLANAVSQYQMFSRKSEGLERDEYPFASTIEGGVHGGVGADNRYIDERDNKNQGNDLKAFYNKRLNKYPGSFFVRAIP